MSRKKETAVKAETPQAAEAAGKKKSPAKKKSTRNAKGQFTKKNTVGKETRFEKENKAACKFKPEYCDMLIEFFSKPVSRVEYKETYYKGELSSKTPIVVAEDFPTFELFAASIGVHSDTLLNWCKEDARFRDCYARAKEIQFGKLTNGGVTGLYNPVYSKFVAVNNHGQKDKQEVDYTGDVKQAFDDKTMQMILRAGKRLNGESES